MSEETKMVKVLSDNPEQQTTLTVSLDNDFFTNNDNGPITKRYLVVAETGSAGQ